MSEVSPRRRRGSVLIPLTGRRGSQVGLLVLEEGQSLPSAELLSDLVEKAGFGWYQVVALVPLIGILISEGAELLVTSSVAAGLQQEWGLTDGQKGSLSSLAFLGLALGTWLSGLLADTWGRRTAILASYAGMTVLGVASAQAGDFVAMAVCRFANGTCCGLGLPATFVLLSELFPKKYRSTSYAVIGISKGLGEMYLGCSLLHWMPDLRHGSWRNVTIVAAIPPAFFFVISLWLMRESPHWLSVKGRMQEARLILLEMATMNGTMEQMQSLADTDVLPAAEKFLDTKAKEEQHFGEVLRTFTSKGRISYNLVCCSILCAIGNVLTWGMGYFWPQLLQSRGHEFDHVGNPATQLIMIRAFALLDCVGCILVMSSPLGLRWIVTLSGCATTLLLSWCWVELGGVGLHLLLAGGMSCACAGVFYSCVLSITSEAFPTEVRAFAAGSCITLGRSGAISAPMLIEALGLRNFLALAASLACSACAFALLLPETKDKPLDDFCDDSPAGDAAEDVEEATPMLGPRERDARPSPGGGFSDGDSADSEQLRSQGPRSAQFPSDV